MDCLYTLLRSFPVGVFATEGRGRVRMSGALKVSMFHVEQLSRLPLPGLYVIQQDIQTVYDVYTTEAASKYEKTLILCGVLEVIGCFLRSFCVSFVRLVGGCRHFQIKFKRRISNFAEWVYSIKKQDTWKIKYRDKTL